MLFLKFISDLCSFSKLCYIYVHSQNYVIFMSFVIFLLYLCLFSHVWYFYVFCVKYFCVFMSGESLVVIIITRVFTVMYEQGWGITQSGYCSPVTLHSLLPSCPIVNVNLTFLCFGLGLSFLSRFSLCLSLFLWLSLFLSLPLSLSLDEQGWGIIFLLPFSLYYPSLSVRLDSDPILCVALQQ